jgi:hypothetical protein
VFLAGMIFWTQSETSSSDRSPRDALRLESVCGGREDIAFLLRRARGGEGDKHSEAGSATMIMRCRS